MAYMSADSFATGEAIGADEALRFSTVELRVIALGERDDVEREFRSDSRIGRLLQWMFGIPVARPLADPHLEVLRRFASKASHRRGALKDEDVEALVAAGYTAGQAWGLTGYFAGRSRPGGNA